MYKLDPNDPRSNYLQIADTLSAEIRSGQYRPGDKLPAHHQVAEQFSVSVGTVKRAFAQLQEDRLIVTRQGQGAYVRDPLPDSATEPAGDMDDVYEQLAAIRQLVDSVERQLRARR